MRALDRKLLRDLWQIRGQALAIAAVIGAGVALYVMTLSAFDSLDRTQHAYYSAYRFADLFGACKRAPQRLDVRLEAIPGVQRVETRVVVDVTLDVAGLSEPAMGRLISIPADHRPALNDIHLVAGRWIEPGRDDEVIVGAPFARSHGLLPGDSVAAVINGRRRELRIVGLGLSPEYVYAIRPGEIIPDDRRFGVLWMGRRPLASAFDMEGGFNDVALTLMPGASEAAVIDRLDHLLKPYGGLGAIARSLQVSHFYLQNELDSLRGMGAIVPSVFLVIAAFLLQSVLSRIIALQREQIAALKALGYSNTALALHYVKWGLVVALAGSGVGLAGGVWLGSGLTRMYTAFFQFPVLLYRLLPSTVVEATSIALIAAVVGALLSVRKAVALPPAEAMRPEPPARFRESWAESIGLKRWLAQPTRMILRNLQRRRGRAALTVLGIALGGSMMIVGNFTYDAFEEVIRVQFDHAQRQDGMISFVEPVSAASMHELSRLPGVTDVEPFRSVPVRLRHGARSRQTAIVGLPETTRLNRLMDISFRLHDLPRDGLVLSSKLAELLHAAPGDTVTVEVLEGRRETLVLPVTRLIDEMMGTNAYMALPALHGVMKEAGSLSGAYFTRDARYDEALFVRLKRTPRVAGVMLQAAAIESFRKTFAENVAIVSFFNVLFAGVIAFGVVYNSARISLSERDRELATLRVIGFTRAEIGYILLGELALLTLLAIPLGLALGYGLSGLTAQAFDTEVFRIPLVILPRTYAYAALTVAVATILSAVVVRRKLNRLDLVAVLKTRE